MTFNTFGSAGLFKNMTKVMMRMLANGAKPGALYTTGWVAHVCGFSDAHARQALRCLAEHEGMIAKGRRVRHGDTWSVTVAAPEERVTRARAKPDASLRLMLLRRPFGAPVGAR